MLKLKYILILFFLGSATTLAQVSESTKNVRIKGTVLGQEDHTPISDVEVSSNRGAYVLTNSLGEYEISVAVGDVLIFSSPEIETIRHRVSTDEDVDVWVKNYVTPTEAQKKPSKNRIGISRNLRCRR